MRVCHHLVHAAALGCALLALAGCGRVETPASRDEDTGAAPAEEATLAPPGGSDTSSVMVRVTSPRAFEVVTSPLIVRGEARGPWYFEASFPVRLVDEQGRAITAAPAQAVGEWMTPGLVPFESTLTFETSARSGKLVLEKNNASGLPEHAASLEVPVRFRN